MKNPPVIVNKLNKLFLLKFGSSLNEDLYVVAQSFENAIKNRIDLKSVELVSDKCEGSDPVNMFFQQS